MTRPIRPIGALVVRAQLNYLITCWCWLQRVCGARFNMKIIFICSSEWEWPTVDQFSRLSRGLQCYLQSVIGRLWLDVCRYQTLLDGGAADTSCVHICCSATDKITSSSLITIIDPREWQWVIVHLVASSETELSRAHLLNNLLRLLLIHVDAETVPLATVNQQMPLYPCQ